MHGQTCSKTRIIAEPCSKEGQNVKLNMHLTCTESFRALVASQQRWSVTSRIPYRLTCRVGPEQSHSRASKEALSLRLFPLKENRSCNTVPQIKAACSQLVSSSFLAFARFYSTSKSDTIKTRCSSQRLPMPLGMFCFAQSIRRGNQFALYEINVQ